jgi:hypothetical protein
MGYTHYLYRAPKLESAAFARFRDEAATLLTALDAELRAEGSGGLAGWDGKGRPEISEERVAFNGVAPEDYESCVIERERERTPTDRAEDDDIDFSFTKTAYRPYDRAVIAVYAIAADHFGEQASLSSDGDDEAIDAGIATAERILGRRLTGVRR